MKRIFLACTLGLVHVAYGATTAAWNQPGGGSWSLSAHWMPGVVPNASQDTADLLSAIIGNAIITSVSGITLGNIHFDNTHNYQVTLSGNTLTFDNLGTANLVVSNAFGSGTHSITAPINLLNPLAVNHTSSSNFTLSGNISGAKAITKAGAGTGAFVLSGTNSYSDTTINVGILQISSNSNLGTGVITFGGGTLRVTASTTITHTINILSTATIESLGSGVTITTSQAITGGGGTLIKIGAGTLALTNAGNSYTTTRIDAGTLSLSGAGALLSTGVLKVNSATSIFDISTIIAAGTTIGEFGGATSSSVVLGNKELTFGGTVGTVLFAGSISDSGSGSIVKQNAGGATFTGMNTFAGGTKINGGALNLSGAGSLLSTGAVNVNSASSIFDISGITPATGATIGDFSSAFAASSVVLGSKALTFGTATASTTFAGVISGAGGSIVKQGSGTAIFSGANTYTNGTTINAGTLEISSDGNLGGVSGGITFGSGTLRTTTGSFTIPSSRAISITSAATFEPTGAITTTVAGVISGSGGTLTKTGTGTLTLTGINLYTGATTISSNTLALSTSGSISTSPSLTISSGTFDISQITSSTTIGDLSGVGFVSLGAKALTLGTSASTTYSGVIQDGGIAPGVGGSITKQGSGTTTFSGANTYTGGTTINAGALSISADTNLGNPTGSITFDGGTLQTTASFTIPATRAISINSTGTFEPNALAVTTTIAAAISGGSLIKIGAGTIVLTSATNSYTGGTTINAGTFSLSGAGVLAATGTVNVNSASSVFNISGVTTGATIGDFIGVSGSSVLLGTKTLTFGTSTDTTFAGVISDSGGGIIVKQGSGTTIFSAANTYTGGTMINAGTLSLSGAGSLLSTGAVNVNSASSTFNISATIGGTTIGDLSSAFATSSVVLGSKALTFGTATGSVTFAGIISGAGGSIFKQGSGAVVFSNANTYTAGTTINDGTLSLSGAGALAPTGAVVVNSASSDFDITAITAATTIGDLSGVSGSSVAIGVKSLTFGTTTSTTFAGSISGSGTIAKQGSGIFTISGANAFIGTFNVNAGELNMASTGSFPFASTTNITAGTTLTGTGTLGAVNLNGTVSPGNSIGTINVGNISFNSGSNFLIELSDTASDKIISSGVVTINSGAILSLMGSGLTTPLPSYLVIDSSAPLVRNGDFTLVNPFTRFDFTVHYDPQDVMILFLQGIIPFSASGNGAGAARCFDNFLGNLPSDLIPVINVLNVQTVAQWQDSFNQMQPSNFDDIALAEENVAERIRQSFSAHLFEQRIESCPNLLPWRLWLTPFVEHVHQHGKGENEGYKENFRGVTVAADYQFMNRWTLTSGFSYVDSNVDIVDGKASGDFKTYAGSVGTIWKNSHFFIDGLLSYLFTKVHAKRTMDFIVDPPPVFFSVDPVTLKANHQQDSNQVMGHLGGGYKFKVDAGGRGNLHVYPFVNIDYLFVMQDGYKEIGAHSLNLSVSSKNYDLLRPEVGLGVGYAGCFKNARVNADVSVSYVREQRFFGKTTKAHFENNSCTFTVKGLSPNNNLVSPTARITVSTTKASPISFSIGYHGEFGSHFIENAGDAEIKVSF